MLTQFFADFLQPVPISDYFFIHYFYYTAEDIHSMKLGDGYDDVQRKLQELYLSARNWRQSVGPALVPASYAVVVFANRPWSTMFAYAAFGREMSDATTAGDIRRELETRVPDLVDLDYELYLIGTDNLNGMLTHAQLLREDTDIVHHRDILAVFILTPEAGQSSSAMVTVPSATTSRHPNLSSLLAGATALCMVLAGVLVTAHRSGRSSPTMAAIMQHLEAMGINFHLHEYFRWLARQLGIMEPKKSQGIYHSEQAFSSSTPQQQTDVKRQDYSAASFVNGDFGVDKMLGDMEVKDTIAFSKVLIPASPAAHHSCVLYSQQNSCDEKLGKVRQVLLMYVVVVRGEERVCAVFLPFRAIEEASCGSNISEMIQGGKHKRYVAISLSVDVNFRFEYTSQEVFNEKFSTERKEFRAWMIDSGAKQQESDKSVFKLYKVNAFINAPMLLSIRWIFSGKPTLITTTPSDVIVSKTLGLESGTTF